MAVDSINYSRELKNLGKEIAELKTEISNMYSALQEIQTQQKNIYEMLGSFEKLLGLIAAGQIINEVEKSLPKKDFCRRKKIFIYGGVKVGKSTLAEILHMRIDNLEITETVAIELKDVPTKPDADLIIFVLGESFLTYYALQRFYNLLTENEKILLVVNPVARFPVEGNDEEIYLKFQSEVRKYYPVKPSDWEKISVVYVYLAGAKMALRDKNLNLFRKSNFEAIENFINAI